MDKELIKQIDQVGEQFEPLMLSKLDEEILICECFCVNVRDIRNLCGDIGIVDVDRLQKELSLGKGCQDCLRRAESWQNKIF